MRIRMTVSGITLDQWEWLDKNIPDAQDMPDNAVRMCVELEVTPGVVRHVELHMGGFIRMMDGLLGHHPPETTRMTPENVPERCHHGAGLVSLDPSVFIGNTPVWGYEDGCQTGVMYDHPKTIVSTQNQSGIVAAIARSYDRERAVRDCHHGDCRHLAYDPDRVYPR